MPTATSDGLTIQYDDLGSGEEALLVLTGWCDNRVQFQPLARHLSAQRRVLVMDWRGHGASQEPPGDFGQEELVRDATAVVQASGVRRVVPVAESHAGWVALELRARLGDAVPRVVLLDWIVTAAPPEFLGALRGLQSGEWAAVRAELFRMWTEGAPEAVRAYVHNHMAVYGQDMWRRAAREIERAYLQHGSPLARLEALAPPVPVLHLFTQPGEEGLALQERFAAGHPWFRPVRLEGLSSHFPAIEAPERCARELLAFLQG